MSTSALTHVRGARGWSLWWSLASGSCPLSSPQWHLAITAGTHSQAFSPSSLSSSPTEASRAQLSALERFSWGTSATLVLPACGRLCPQSPGYVVDFVPISGYLRLCMWWVLSSYHSGHM